MTFCSVFGESFCGISTFAEKRFEKYWKFIVSVIPVMIAVGLNLFPFRTEKLKPPAPKILEEISGKIGRRRDNAYNIYFCGYPTPWISPIALRTIVGFNGRRSDNVYNTFTKSLVLVLSFIYNPLVLKRTERGFSSVLEITAPAVSFS